MSPGTVCTMISAIVAVIASGALACGQMDRGDGVSAIAMIEPTRDYETKGTVRLESLDEGGVRVIADLKGLSSGRHAFHVHEVGDCSEEAAAAGPHFNFLTETEASEPPPQRITGNLGELEVDDSGRARLEATIGMAQLEGPRSIVGRSVVVHARGNDASSPPDGDAGERIACGVIEPVPGRNVASNASR